ncbi:MAG: Release factor glutamine methyltransferase [Methanonatronarchaeales archaeon]|nr:Release factor glutamine methyltransferase [Methanonatronarchaeales archaeon]
MELERLDGFDDPSAKLEQYSTPAPIAAEVLHLAHSRGELEGRVVDLGCGTGVFAVGASLLGSDAIGVDVDPGALETARENASALGAGVEFILGDVEDLELEGDLVIQNPPFGAQSHGADRPFMERAMEAAPVAYSLHNAATRDFVRRHVETRGGRARVEGTYEFPIPRSHHFHRRDVGAVKVDLYRFESEDG